MFKILRIFMALLLALALLSAQAAADEDIPKEQTSPEKPAEPQLVALSSATNKPWRLAELLGEALPNEETTPYLLLTNTNDLVGFGGCNFFIGKYQTGGDGRITVSSLRASHQQCPEVSERETKLLTSLVMANNLQLSDEGLTFAMEANILMKLRDDSGISVDELLQQGRLIKAQAHKKTRSKKKKIAVKAKKLRKAAAPKITSKTRPAVKKPAKPVKAVKSH